MTSTKITTRARAFNGIMETHRVLVEDDGTIRVYDSIAGHYTICHSLSASAQRRIRRLAAEQQELACLDSLSGERFVVQDGADKAVEAAIREYIRDGIDSDSGEVEYRVETSDGRCFDGTVNA